MPQIDCATRQSHTWVEPSFYACFQHVAMGDRIDHWRVCRIGGWDNCRVLFVVMVGSLLFRPGINETDLVAVLRRDLHARNPQHGYSTLTVFRRGNQSRIRRDDPQVAIGHSQSYGRPQAVVVKRL